MKRGNSLHSVIASLKVGLGVLPGLAGRSLRSCDPLRQKWGMVIPPVGWSSTVAMSDRVTLNVPREVYERYKDAHSERYPDQTPLWILLSDLLDEESESTIVID